MLKAFTVDFTYFNIQMANVDEIQVKEVNTEVIADTLGQRKIKQFELLYNNLYSHAYEMELMVLISCVETADPTALPSFEIFGAPAVAWESGMIEFYKKPLKKPLTSR